MHLLSQPEKDEWFRDHLPHRLSILISPLVRTDTLKQCPDLYQAALHGSFVIFRSLLEFTGLKSDPKKNPIELRDFVSHNPSDIQIRHFGHILVPLTDPWVAKHSQLLAITHDGVSKACAHLTYQSGHTFNVNKHYYQACAGLLSLLKQYLYEPEGRPMDVWSSLPHPKSLIDEITKHRP